MTLVEAQEVQAVVNHYDALMSSLNSYSMDIVRRHVEVNNYFGSLSASIITVLGTAHSEMMTGIGNVGTSIDGLYAPGMQATSLKDAQAQATAQFG